MCKMHRKSTQLHKQHVVLYIITSIWLTSWNSSDMRLLQSWLISSLQWLILSFSMFRSDNCCSSSILWKGVSTLNILMLIINSRFTELARLPSERLSKTQAYLFVLLLKICQYLWCFLLIVWHSLILTTEERVHLCLSSFMLSQTYLK